MKGGGGGGVWISTVGLTSVIVGLNPAHNSM